MPSYNDLNLVNEESYKNNVLHKIDTKQYTIIKGIDIGRKYLVAGSRKLSESVATPFKFRSARFYHMARFQDIRRERFTLCKTIDKIYDPQSCAFHIADARTYRQFIIFRLEMFEQKQAIYSQREVARLAFKAYIWLDKIATWLAKRYLAEVPRKKRYFKRIDPKTNKKHKSKKLMTNKQTLRTTLLFIGTCGRNVSNDPIKGYMRSPIKRFMTKVKLFADVIHVGEYRTSQVCSSCHGFVQGPVRNYNRKDRERQPNHRFVYCPNCRKQFVRDVNAGANIMANGSLNLRQMRLPDNFFDSVKNPCR